MSNFLKKLYDEEMSKVGSTEFSSIMEALPRTELEDYLGLGKRASEEQPSDDEKRKMQAGAKAKPEAKGQDVEPETNLQAKQASVQRVLGVMQKLAVGGPPEVPLPDSAKGLQAKQDAIHKGVQSGEGQKVTVPVDHQGPGKEAIEVERGGKKVTTTKTAMAWADDMGRKLAAAKLKTAYGPEPAEQQGSTVDATEKAKVAMMAFQSTRHAPENIQQAAIKLAGMKIAGA